MASVTSVQHTQVPPAAVVCLDSVSDQDLHAANAVELERLDTSSARQPSVLLATAQASSKFHASQPVPLNTSHTPQAHSWAFFLLKKPPLVLTVVFSSDHLCGERACAFRYACDYCCD